MSKCAKEIRDFHDKEVDLAESKQRDIRDKANANQQRIKRGLAEKGPKPVGFWPQGSYAMRTMINRRKNDYDIDTGCYFNSGDIGDITPSALRQKIRDAVTDERFNTPPEIKKNCVRIHYDEGYHVDVPVYKVIGKNSVRLASAQEWLDSDPLRITQWFEQQVDAKKPVDLRKIVRLLKAFCSNSPSGLVISALASKIAIADCDDDEMLHQAMKDIKALLKDANFSVSLMGETLEPQDSAVIIKFHDRLAKALDDLAVLDNPSSSKIDQLKAWHKVYPCDFFENLIKKEIKEVADSVRKGFIAPTIGGGVAATSSPSSGQTPPKSYGQ